MAGMDLGRYFITQHSLRTLVSEAVRTATVTATSELRLLEIPFWDFRDFAHSNPDVTWKLLQHVVALTQGR